MEQWVKLALELQEFFDNEVSRLTVATVIAEVRADLRADGLGDDQPEVVRQVASMRLAEMLEQRRAVDEALRPAGVRRAALG
jgi:hypothetical protein